MRGWLLRGYSMDSKAYYLTFSLELPLMVIPHLFLTVTTLQMFVTGQIGQPNLFQFNKASNSARH